MDQDFKAGLKAELAEALEGIARADGIVRRIEVETCEAIFSEILNASALCDGRPLASSGAGGALSLLARLPLALKCKLVKLCWLLAESDGQLHPAEEEAIYALADRIALDRRIVAMTQPELHLPLPSDILIEPVSHSKIAERLAARI